jgi:pimeloyl-ACP methyl ester carboxylesterase
MFRTFLLLLSSFVFFPGCATRSSGPATKSDTHIIRFNNNGDVSNPEALEEAVKQIRSAPQTVVVYMHGWKGTSSSWDSNVQGFHRHLQVVRKRTFEPHGRQLTGVYFTWNARRLPSLAENLGYWGTRNRADEIANGSGVANALEALSQASANNGRENFLVAGHSMGGRIIGRVIGRHPALLRHIDLVLLINSADDSDSARKTINSVKGYGRSSGRIPQLVWVTSEADTATGKIFPIAENGKLAVGHDPSIQTHRFELTSSGPGQYPRGTFTPELSPPPVYFRNVIVRKDLIHNHSDIWAESMRAILNYCLWADPY